MPLFKCSKCGCCENTALGWHWTAELMVDRVDLSDVGEEYYDKPLCSECAPTKFKSGEPTRFTHKWHGKFPKEPYKEE